MGLDKSTSYLEHLIREYFSLYESRKDRTFAELPDELTGETIVCAGCGPSLNGFDADRICEAASLICTNSAGLWARRTTDRPIGQILSDTSRLFGPHLDPILVPTFVTPYYLTEEWLEKVRLHPYRILKTDLKVDLTGRHPRARPENLLFPSMDVEGDGINICGQSVIFQAIQLAVCFGAKRIVLIGTEMDYSGQTTHFRETEHINQRYEWERDSRPAMIAFRDVLTRNGIELLNATPGGKIDVLPRVDLWEVIE